MSFLFFKFYLKKECAVVSWSSSLLSLCNFNCLIQYTIAEAQTIMKIQLIVFAANQDDNSNERIKSSGANKMSTNKYCIASKNAFIMYKINFSSCFFLILPSKNSYFKESF